MRVSPFIGKVESANTNENLKATFCHYSFETDHCLVFFIKLRRIRFEAISGKFKASQTDKIFIKNVILR